MQRTAWIRSDDERLASRNFEAVSWFRGHRELAPFSITPYGAGLQIAFEPPQELKSTVTVRGRLMAESYVIFILDYSASMLKTVSEAGQGDQYRYAMAREVLVSFLERLSRIPDNPYRVGVMLYGHRRCWANDRLIREYGLPATTRTVKWEYKNGWRLVGADDDFIDPDRDVEMIWPPLWPPRQPRQAGYRPGEGPLAHAIANRCDAAVSVDPRRRTRFGETSLAFGWRRARGAADRRNYRRNQLPTNAPGGSADRGAGRCATP